MNPTANGLIEFSPTQMRVAVKWVSVEGLKRLQSRLRANGFRCDLTDEMLETAGGGCDMISISDSQNGLYVVPVMLRKVGGDAANATVVWVEMDQATWDSIPYADG